MFPKILQVFGLTSEKNPIFSGNWGFAGDFDVFYMMIHCNSGKNSYFIWKESSDNYLCLGLQF